MSPSLAQKNSKKSNVIKSITTLIKNNDVKFKIILLIAICSFMIIRGIMQQPEILENKEKINQLNEEIAYEKSRQNEVEKMRSNVETDEYIERIARDKLGMIKQNEKIFVDVSATE